MLFRVNFLLLGLMLLSSVSSADPVLNEPAKAQIASALSTEGKVTVIVGLSELNQANSLSASLIKSAKTQFLRSTPVVKSLVSRSIQVIDELEHLPFVVMQVDIMGLQTLKTHPKVISIEADFPHEAYLKEAVPDIFGIENPWGKSIYNGAGTWVAILDSGVNVGHPMFQGKQIIQACFTSDNSCPNNTNTQYGGNAADPIPKGKSNHGTHVAGVAVGNYIPAKQFGGVAHKANLIAVQVFDQDGLAYNTSLLRALNYIYSLLPVANIAAVNISIGRAGKFQFYCDDQSPSFTNAVIKLRNENVATVAAIGLGRGGGGGHFFPSCISSVITVTGAEKPEAPDSEYTMWTYNYSPQASFIAPAVDIESAAFGNNYLVKKGTSLAAAMVSGAFAVISKIKPNATVSAIETALQNTGMVVHQFPVKDRYSCLPLDCKHSFFVMPFPVIKKAPSQVGGSSKLTTAIGFNTASSVERLKLYSNFKLVVEDGLNVGANGVANVVTTTQKGYYAPFPHTRSFFLFPQTVLTGRIAAKLRFINPDDEQFGLIVRAGGQVLLNQFDPQIHDGYILNIKNSGEYGVSIFRFGQRRQIIPWTDNPNIVKMNDWNVLMATFGGKTVKFYVNGHLVGQHSSNRLIYGASGVHFTITQPSSGAYIDWMVLKSNVVNDRYH